MNERRLAVFRAAGPGLDTTVAVNPDAIWYLKAGKAGTVAIYFSSEHSVTVSGDFNSVASLLGFGLPSGWEASVAKTLPRGG